MAEPKRTTEELAHEAEAGRSERTPWITLGGVHLAVLAAVLVIGVLAFTAYLIA